MTQGYGTGFLSYVTAGAAKGSKQVRALPFLLSVACMLTISACGVDTVVHNIDEREANQIIELLADNDIQATKNRIDNGRTVSYSVAVSPGDKLLAIKTLNRFDMPRRHDMGYNDVFKDSGLIPTSSEERAKQLSALEGEIEKQLKLVEGVLDVQVQLVIPEESPLRAMDEVKAVATAGVAVKYLPGAGGTKPLSEAQIQAIVAAGTEGLTADRVVVVMTPGGGPSAKYALNPEAAETSGSGLKRLSSLTLNILGVFALIALLGLGALLSVTSMQLSAVRGRLSRLQNEVSKAKRKPGDYTGTVV